MSQYENMKLLISFVERGTGAQLIKLYRDHQVLLHVQCAGHGTATSEILDILGLGSSEKDVILSFGTQDAANLLLQKLDDDLRGQIKTSGIVLKLPLSAMNSIVAAILSIQTQGQKSEEKEDDTMTLKTENSLILVVCNRGYTDAVMATAKKAGARGGTSIKARWTGFEDWQQDDDNLPFQSDKEVIAISVSNELRNAIMQAINEEHGIKSKSQSVIVSLPVEDQIRLG